MNASFPFQFPYIISLTHKTKTHILHGCSLHVHCMPMCTEERHCANIPDAIHSKEQVTPVHTLKPKLSTHFCMHIYYVVTFEYA